MFRRPHPAPSSSTTQDSPTFGRTLDSALLNSLPIDRRIAMLGAHAALKAYAPDIPKPPLAVEFVPAVGPLWQAAEQLQDGKYFGAVANTGLAGVDALSVGAGSAGLKTARAVGAELGGKLMNGRNVQKAARDVAGIKQGDPWEAHHTIPLGDSSLRPIKNWRHEPALIKVLPTATHRRLHGSYQGQPRFGPLARAWHGTTDWMKGGAAQIGARAVDAVDHLVDGDRRRDGQRRRP